MGFGWVLFLLIALGFLILGPKQMGEALRQFAIAKSKLDRSARELKAELVDALDKEASPRD